MFHVSQFRAKSNNLADLKLHSSLLIIYWSNGNTLVGVDYLAKNSTLNYRRKEILTLFSKKNFSKKFDTTRLQNKMYSRFIVFICFHRFFLINEIFLTTH